MRGDVDVMEYVVINEYGGMLPWTAGSTKQECLANFCADGRKPEDLKPLGCAIFRLVPIFVEGAECNRFTKQPHLDLLAKGKTE